MRSIKTFKWDATAALSDNFYWITGSCKNKVGATFTSWVLKCQKLGKKIVVLQVITDFQIYKSRNIAPFWDRTEYINCPWNNMNIFGSCPTQHIFWFCDSWVGVSTSLLTPHQKNQTQTNKSYPSHKWNKKIPNPKLISLIKKKDYPG